MQTAHILSHSNNQNSSFLIYYACLILFQRVLSKDIIAYPITAFCPCTLTIFPIRLIIHTPSASFGYFMCRIHGTLLHKLYQLKFLIVSHYSTPPCPIILLRQYPMQGCTLPYGQLVHGVFLGSGGLIK